MIVHLATYPRSGNSLLKQLIVWNFHFLTISPKANPDLRNVIEGILAVLPNCTMTPAPAAPEESDGQLIWNERTAIYQWPGESRHRYVLIDPDEANSPDIRRSLAAEDDLFFVKTHELPFDEYFPGEHVLQHVRHPGAALWSYFRYLVDFKFRKGLSGKLLRGPAPTLENVIAGAFTDWSDYHARWRSAGERLGERYLCLGFETTQENPLRSIEKIADFLSLPVRSQKLPDFEKYRTRFEGNDLRGRSDGYEAFFSGRQLELLWQSHSAMAERFGFTAPDFSLAAPDEQIRRLGALIDSAWENSKAAGQNRA
jgi:hypothetical protein